MPYKFKTAEKISNRYTFITTEIDRTVILRYGNLLSNITIKITKWYLLYLFILIYLATLSVPRFEMNTVYWRDKIWQEKNVSQDSAVGILTG